MANPTRIDVNCTTGEVQEIELTDEEVAQLNITAAKWQAEDVERKALDEARIILKESAKAKLVAGEPLTEEEAATIVL